MAKTFLTSINLVGNELQNATIQNLPTAPASPEEGQIYYNSTPGTKRPMYYNGTAWSLFGHTTSEINNIVRATPLTGYTVGTNSALGAGDTVLDAFRKVQGQINAIPRGTVTSVGMTVPTGLSVTPASITTSGTFAVTLHNDYSIPTKVKQGQWDVASNDRITAVAFSGTTTKTITLTQGDTSTLTASFTDNNTTYTAGAGLKLTSTAFAIDTAHANSWTVQQTFGATTGIKIGSAILKYDETNNALYVEGLTTGSAMNFYATGEVSAYGAGSGSSSSGSGLIENVYDYNDLGGIYDNAILTDTFNAYTINKINTDLGSKIASLEAGSALTFTTNGTGNAVTSVTKSGTSVTVTKGTNFASLDENGLIISAQLPSYVDDVLEFATLANFPTTGESGKIYVAINTNITYRWSGTAYVEISKSLALGNTASTAYRGDHGLIAYTHSQAEHQTIINGTGFVKANGKVLSYDNASYEVAFSKNTAFNKSFGTTAGTVTQGNDSRLSDSRTPTKKTGVIGTGLTTVVTHGLGSADIIASVMTTAGEVVECDIINTTTTTTFRFNVEPSASTYKYVIIG